MEVERPSAQGVADQIAAEEAVRTILRFIGEDPNRPGLVDTPGRVVRSFLEMTDGYRLDVEQILARRFPEQYDAMVILRGCPFTSLCEHHLLPFSGHATVAYIPNEETGMVLGLSKMARLVDLYARRLQVQERLTNQIAAALEQFLRPRGVGVIVRAEHACMACRGIKKPGAEMITSAMLGFMRDDPKARAELLDLSR